MYLYKNHGGKEAIGNIECTKAAILQKRKTDKISQSYSVKPFEMIKTIPLVMKIILQ